MTKVCVLLSSGLDSTFTIYKLLQDGYQVSAVHFSNGFGTDDTIERVKQIGEFFHIDVDFVCVKKEFDELLREVDVELCHMTNPNICVKCARDIKFGYMLKYAEEKKYDCIATGHYVKIEHVGKDIIVKKAIDESRDQSYGFSVIPNENLRKVITPLGYFLKKNIRAIADEIGIPYTKKESHNLCFTKKPFKEFYMTYVSHPMIQGNFIIGNIKKPHEGIQLYTRGQNISINGQKYTVDRKLPNGDIQLSEREKVFDMKIAIERINFHVKDFDISKEYQIQGRYNATPVTCRIESLTNERMIVMTNTPVFAPTKGQIGSLYDGDKIILGGFIC